MFRTLLAAITILHLGPGIAFGLLAFGCDGAATALPGLCGRSGLSGFAWMTLGSWLVLGLAHGAVVLVRRAAAAAPPATGLRAGALLCSAGAGLALGATGAWATGSQAWYLALPAALAAGWLFLANPAACRAGAGGSAGAG